MTVEELIKLKSQRLSTVPEELFTGIEAFQVYMFETIMAMLSELEVKKGVFTKTTKNLRIAADIRQELEKVLSGKEYLKAIIAFGKEFDTQKEVTDKYFKKVFSGFEIEKVNDMVMKQAQNNAIELLTSATPKTGFLSGIETQIRNAVSTRSSFTDLVRILRVEAIGVDDPGLNDRYITPKDGKLLRYAKQVASDTLALSDRSYTSSVADSLGAEWFLYFGDELPTSREFCVERHGKYFHKKEVEAWAKLDWKGKMADSTNEQTIFINCGGWRCQHSILPVTIDQVPRDVIIRNMNSGNFKPTAFDIKELNLPAA